MSLVPVAPGLLMTQAMLLDGWVEGSPAQRPLAEGSLHLGSGPDDDWNIPGLPPGAVLLRWEDGAVTVETRAAQLEIQGEQLLPGRPRLLLPDERLTWGTESWLALRDPAPRSASFTRTVELVRGLLRGEDVGGGLAAPSLIALTGRDLGRSFFLTDWADAAQWELGRGEEVAVRLRDRSVSRRHARLRCERDTLWAEDLGGPNGLTVNGQPVVEPVALQDGDVLGLGYARLKYRAAAPRIAPEAQTQKETGASAEADISAEEPPEELPWAALPSDGWLVALFTVAAAVGLWSCLVG